MFGVNLLWTHVLQRADHLLIAGQSCQRRVGSRAGRGDTEVDDSRIAVFVDEDVPGFEVAVNDTAVMTVLNGIADLTHELDPLPCVQSMSIGVLSQW